MNQSFSLTALIYNYEGTKVEEYIESYQLQLTIYQNKSNIYSKNVSSAEGIALFNGLSILSEGICQISIASNFLETYTKNFNVIKNHFQIDFQPVTII